MLSYERIIQGDWDKLQAVSQSGITILTNAVTHVSNNFGASTFDPLQIGYNSPVGLIISNTTNQTTATNIILWAVNIGGSSIDNFSHGIRIPIFVVVFGFIGGYLRYLYKSARLKTLNVPSNQILVFRWDKVPGTDSERLRSFLREKFDIEWLVSQEFKKSNNNLLTIEAEFDILEIGLSEDGIDKQGTNLPI